VVRFATFEFEPASGELTKQGRRVPLERQPAKALALLLEHPATVVTREQLKQALWNGDVHVDFDRGLAYCIAQVRTALGDSAENPRFVETLPKRGFRFIAPVHPGAEAPGLHSEDPGLRRADNPGAEAPGLHSEDPGIRRAAPALIALLGVAAIIAIVMFMFAGERPVLAVAIFDNETGQAAHDGFTSGLSDAMVIHLSALDAARIGVIGNARSLRMPRSDRDLAAIAADTGASHILLGQLQNFEGGLRLFTHLIRLSDGKHVWVKRIDRADGQLAGVEQEALLAVEAGVRQHMLAQLPPPSPAPASR
jgi:DNA-binding winged helix-turn-helix (wHTH) protein/TolB-like protein